MTYAGIIRFTVAALCFALAAQLASVSDSVEPGPRMSVNR